MLLSAGRRRPSVAGVWGAPGPCSAPARSRVGEPASNGVSGTGPGPGCGSRGGRSFIVSCPPEDRFRHFELRSFGFLSSFGIRHCLSVSRHLPLLELFSRLVETPPKRSNGGVWG